MNRCQNSLSSAKISVSSRGGEPALGSSPPTSVAAIAVIASAMAAKRKTIILTKPVQHLVTFQFSKLRVCLLHFLQCYTQKMAFLFELERTMNVMAASQEYSDPVKMWRVNIAKKMRAATEAVRS